MSLNFVRVGDLSEQIRGVTYGKEDASKTPASGYLPVLRAGNITDNGLFYGDLVYVPAGKVSAKQKLRIGDVVVAASSGSLDVVGKTAPVLADFDGGFGAFCKVLRPNARVEPKYFAQFFKRPEYRTTISSLAAGANINNLRNEHLDELLMPLPTLPEQRRIAAILDQADALRTKRREALGQLDSLTQSIFIEMFGDPVTNPNKWKVLPFKEACETKLGKMLDARQQTGQDKRRYLRNANVQWFRIDLFDLLEMDFDSDARRTFNLQKGDLLICEGGEPGRAAIWKGELEDVYFQKALHRGRPKLNLANPEYLVWLLWFLAQNGGLGDHVTAATIAHLTGEKLKAMPIPLPPLALQQNFATRLQAIDALKTSHRAALQELDMLFAALQNRAFQGEL